MATEKYSDPLADWLHEQGIGCDPEPKDRFDIGMGYRHTGDHEADAAALREALSAAPHS